MSSHKYIKLIYKNMRILGIDPGFGTIGFGVIELIETDWEMIDFGAITTSPNEEFSRRLLQIYDDVTTLIEEFKPNAFAIEELFFVQNVSTGMQVSEARGVLMLAASQAGLPIYEYAPNEIKMSITGYGQADKSQMQKMMQTLLNLNQKPRPDDAADALAVALTCGFEVVNI
jgi:crossover junction endodeoxyribonuclease RuvC